jgi:hypothetical protein
MRADPMQNRVQPENSEGKPSAQPKRGGSIKSCPLGLIALAATILSAASPNGSSLWAQTTQDSFNTQTSSSTVTDQLPPSFNPSRTKVTREESGNRVVEKTAVETMGPDGHYQPYLDVEKETVKVNATTVHIVERSYAQGPDGRKQLVQVKEEESRTLRGVRWKRFAPPRIPISTAACGL